MKIWIRTAAASLATMLMISSTSYSAEVWYTSNVGTHDFLDMFMKPELWATARSKIHVMKFYMQQLIYDNAQDCPSCEQNTFPAFVERDAFRKLRDWNIKIAIETGAVKPFDCEATANVRLTTDLFRKMKRYNSVVHYIALDEPFISGKEYCNNQPEDLTARHTARYVQDVMREFAQIFPGETLQIGLIEAYPHFSAKQIVHYVNLLQRFGADLKFIQLDVDRFALKNKGMNDFHLKRDLMILRRLAEVNGIPLHIIFWGQESHSDAKYSKNVMEFVQRVKRLYGTPDVIGFQSWETTPMPDGSKVSRIPNNLHDRNPNSHTGLVVKALQVFGL